MKRVAVTMPRWPAYVMGAFALACAYPAITASAPAPDSKGAPAAKPAEAAPAANLAKAAAGITSKTAD